MNSQMFAPNIITAAPKKLAEIKFLNGESVKPGNEILYKKIVKAPRITWEFETCGLYTLFLINPDAQTQICNWLVVNIPGNCIRKGHVLTDYTTPRCTARQKVQRLILLIFKQTDMITKDKIFFQITSEECIHVKSSNYITKYKLGNLLAGNYFKIKF